MSNFRVGQKVVCIDDSVNPYGVLATYPKKGVVYAVRGVHPDGDAIFLDSIINPLIGGREPCFLNYRFRPVVERKTDISIFKAMLNTEHAKERA